MALADSLEFEVTVDLEFFSAFYSLVYNLVKSSLLTEEFV